MLTVHPTTRFVTTALLAVLAVTASADQVHLQNGNVVEGRAHRAGDSVVIVTPAGEVKLPASEVTSIVKSRSVLDDYDDRVKALRTEKKVDDAAAHVALAEWCRGKDMRSHGTRHLRRALELDPDNAVARKKLGYVRHEDQWLTEPEYYAARGFVKHRGKWVHHDELRRRRYAVDAKKRLDAHKKKVQDCVQRMSSPRRLVRQKARTELQSYAEGRGDLELASFASRVADHYNGEWREVRRILSRGTALTEVRATMSKLKRPIPTITTSLGANSTPVRIQTPELSIVSVRTTAQIPLTIELDEDP